jgi:peptidoglycan/LPS O-acetylase OafA/YrhL
MRVCQKEENPRENNLTNRVLFKRDSPCDIFQFHHLPQLDGFRGVAVILVVIGHLLEFSIPLPAWSSAGADLAALGVFMFFVLSGFLITSLLYAERRDKGNVRLLNFYVRRVLRLAPALLVFLLVVTTLMVFRAVTDVPWYELLACLFYGRNFIGHSDTLSHLWSLSLEEQFYLCWPIAFSLLPLKRAFQFCVWVTGLMVVWRGLAIHFGIFDYSTGIYFMRPYFRFDSILIGACVAIPLAQYPGLLSWARAFCGRIPAAPVWVVLFLWSFFGEAISKPFFLTFQMILIAFLLLQLVIAQQGFWYRLFSHPALCYVGKICYSLYLWQQLFLMTKRPDWGMIRRFPWDIFAIVALALLSYYCVEKPVLRLKERFQVVES